MGLGGGKVVGAVIPLLNYKLTMFAVLMFLHYDITWICTFICSADRPDWVETTKALDEDIGPIYGGRRGNDSLNDMRIICA